MVQVTSAGFQLKADMLALTVFQLQSANLGDIAHQLDETVRKAPKYFQQAPVIIDLREINANAINLSQLVSMVREYGIIPVGLRGLNDSQQQQVKDLGLPFLNSQAPVEAPVESKGKKDGESAPARASKLLTKQVRAGTRIYAKDADLIVVGSVNAGAECIADGHIHVYGPLRGRALAGACGDSSARIFCHSLEAELIAIAGHYQVRENINVPESANSMIQVYLDNNKLSIQGI